LAPFSYLVTNKDLKHDQKHGSYKNITNVDHTETSKYGQSAYPIQAFNFEDNARSLP
jgi:hypothetical protein